MGVGAALVLAALAACSPDRPVEVATGKRATANSEPVTTSPPAPASSTTTAAASPTSAATTGPRATTATVPVTTTTRGPDCAPAPHQFGPYVFDAHLVDGALGFAAGTRTIWVTTDGGATWTAACLPAGAQFVHALAVRGQKAWAAGIGEEGGSAFILRSTDGGRVWRLAQVPAGATYLMDIAFPDDDHGWVVGRRPQTDPAYGDQYGGGALLLRSTDGGATWTLSQDFPPDVAGGLSGLSFPDPDHGWVSGQTRGDTAVLLATADGGDTWRAQALPAEVRQVHDVFFVDRDRGWITADLSPTTPGTESAILATADGGGTWAVQWQGTNTSPSGLEFADAAHGWAVANPGAGGTVLRTSDGGATWTAVLTPGRALTKASFSDTRHGWVSGLQGAFVYATGDGGATWETRPITGP